MSRCLYDCDVRRFTEFAKRLGMTHVIDRNHIAAFHEYFGLQDEHLSVADARNVRISERKPRALLQRDEAPVRSRRDVGLVARGRASVLRAREFAFPLREIGRTEQIMEPAVGRRDAQTF